MDLEEILGPRTLRWNAFVYMWSELKCSPNWYYALAHPPFVLPGLGNILPGDVDSSAALVDPHNVGRQHGLYLCACG